MTVTTASEILAAMAAIDDVIESARRISAGQRRGWKGEIRTALEGAFAPLAAGRSRAEQAALFYAVYLAADGELARMPKEARKTNFGRALGLLCDLAVDLADERMDRWSVGHRRPDLEAIVMRQAELLLLEQKLDTTAGKVGEATAAALRQNRVRSVNSPSTN